MIKELKIFKKMKQALKVHIKNRKKLFLSI